MWTHVRDFKYRWRFEIFREYIAKDGHSIGRRNIEKNEEIKGTLIVWRNKITRFKGPQKHRMFPQFL